MESPTSQLGLAELNAAALDQFVYQPVSRSMIAHLANAAFNVIQCDPTMMPPTLSDPRDPRRPDPSPPRSPPPRAVRSDDGSLPSLEDFITRLVVSSNVQVPTLMSTLVYLNRLKSRLQPMAKGLRCTTHRIFLAALILSAKYLNDSSPKNKHWANYSVISTETSSFGFSRTEVNLMEKQLLFLLDWNLSIAQDDLYREFDPFLAPIRRDIEARHIRRQRRKAEDRAARRKKEEAEAWVAVAHGAAAPVSYPTPPSSRGSSLSRHGTPLSDTIRDVSPPALTYSSSYSSSASSYASSSSSRIDSRSTTPLSDLSDPITDSYGGAAPTDVYESPIQVVLDPPTVHGKDIYTRRGNKQLLPYEISAEELRDLQDGGNRVKRMRGVFGRVFGSGGNGVAVR